MADYLVTGAAGGMGAAVCRAIAAAGGRAWGVDLRAAPGILEADVTDGESLNRVFEELRGRGAALDGIVHTAGIYDLGSLVEMEESGFVRDFDVNLFGMFRVNKTFFPLLKPRGRIVMVSSELAPIAPLPFTGIYGITKSAVEKYAAALRMELALLGHSVTVIRPGAVDTGMLPCSVDRMERFCEWTKLYSVAAGNFRRVVNAVESECVPPEAVARKVMRALKAKRPRRVYCVNRSPLLLLMNAVPERVRLAAIKRILGGKRK